MQENTCIGDWNFGMPVTRRALVSFFRAGLHLGQGCRSQLRPYHRRPAYLTHRRAVDGQQARLLRRLRARLQRGLRLSETSSLPASRALHPDIVLRTRR